MLKSLPAWYARHKLVSRIIAGLVILYSLAGFAAAPLIVRHNLEKNASAALHRDVRAAEVRTNPFTFSLRLIDLTITERDGDASFVRIGRLVVNADPLISLFKRGVVIRSVQIDSPRIHIIRNNDRCFNFSDLLDPSPAKPSDKSGPESKSVRLILDELKLVAGEIQFVDKTRGMPFETKVKALEATVNGLDTLPDAQPFHYALHGGTEADEQFEIQGKSDIHPFSLEARATLKNLSPAKYAPYYQSHLNADVTRGRIDIQAGLQWDGQTRTVSGLQISVDDLVLKTAKDPQTLVNLPRFIVDGAAVDFANRQIRMGRIESQAARIFLQRNSRGQLNLQTAFAPRPSAASARIRTGEETGQTPRTAPWKIAVPELNLDDYAVDFEDLQPSTPVRTRMHRINLAARDLSTDPQTLGQIDLEFHWADQGTLATVGQVGLSPLQADLEVTADKLDIRPLQSYLQEFVKLVFTDGEFSAQGRMRVAPGEDTTDLRFTGQASLNSLEAVDAEKATLFSRWKSLYLTGIQIGTKPPRAEIDKVALTDFYNRLSFGAPIASPQATKLPVKLAVSLLKDRSGNIDLDLPVKGDLDDPRFSLGGIILKMFVNLITQIASSPFKVLGAVFGGGEELAYLAFDPGRSAITPLQTEKLDTLEEILFERPGLRLEIQGGIAPQEDADGLRRLRFEEQLKSGKLKEMVASGRNAVPLELIEIAPQERNAMIQKAFDAADFPKPREKNGSLKKLSIPEMEKLLYTAIGIGADDLRRLAHDRASAAKAYLLDKGRIESGRLFVVEPRIPGDNSRKNTGPQVQFNLK